MEHPSNFEYHANNWVSFKAWLKEEHTKGNTRLGIGVNNIGFVAYTLDHTIKHKDLPARLKNLNNIAQVLQDFDDDLRCYICLIDKCDCVPIQMQIAWARHFFLPIEESDYCLCEDCKQLISNHDIQRYRLKAGRTDLLPRICDNCSKNQSKT